MFSQRTPMLGGGTGGADPLAVARSHPRDCTGAPPLHETTHAVGRLIAGGMTQAEVAEELQVAVNTVKWHVLRLRDHVRGHGLEFHGHGALVRFLGILYRERA